MGQPNVVEEVASERMRTEALHITSSDDPESELDSGHNLADDNLDLGKQPETAQLTAHFKRQTNSKLKTLQVRMSWMQSFHEIGIRKTLVRLTWCKLLLLLISVYALGGWFLGLLLFLMADEESRISDTESNAVFYFYRGFAMLFGKITWKFQTVGECILVVVSLFGAKIFFLYLFGVISAKFALRQSLIQFSKDIMLRKGLGNYPMLVFRYAHTAGEILVNPVIKLTILRRRILPDGEGMVVGELLEVNGNSHAAIPEVFFITHIIDEKSPLFDSEMPFKINLTGIVRMLLTVSGVELIRQEGSAGCGNWGTDSILLDSMFAAGHQGHGFDFEAFNRHAILPKMAWFNPGGVSRASFGLNESHS